MGKQKVRGLNEVDKTMITSWVKEINIVTTKGYLVSSNYCP